MLSMLPEKLIQVHVTTDLSGDYCMAFNTVCVGGKASASKVSECVHATGILGSADKLEL